MNYGNIKKITKKVLLICRNVSLSNYKKSKKLYAKINTLLTREQN